VKEPHPHALPTLEELWQADEPEPLGTHEPGLLAGLPTVARRYFEHSIDPGAPLYRAVRLHMRGQIKFGSWRPFEAEQVVRWGRGLIWRAKAKMAPLVAIKGQDTYVDGVGAMRWKLLGIIPVLTADGPDTTRSAAARAAIDSFLLPPSLLAPGVEWAAEDDEYATVKVPVPGDEAQLRLRIDPRGSLGELSMQRWGNPEGGEFQAHSFGGYLGADRRFGALTLPTQIRCGWYFGSDRYADEGEFFRATIDAAEFR
jgi:hypothetical protein